MVARSLYVGCKRQGKIEVSDAFRCQIGNGHRKVDPPGVDEYLGLKQWLSEHEAELFTPLRERLGIPLRERHCVLRGAPYRGILKNECTGAATRAYDRSSQGEAPPLGNANIGGQ
jgi:hypothetical protein